MKKDNIETKSVPIVKENDGNIFVIYENGRLVNLGNKDNKFQTFEDARKCLLKLISDFPNPPKPDDIQLEIPYIYEDVGSWVGIRKMPNFNSKRT